MYAKKMYASEVFMNRLLDLLFCERCACCNELVEYGRHSPFCRTCQAKWESEKFQLRSFEGELPTFEYTGVDGEHSANRVVCTVAYDPDNPDAAASGLIFKLKRYATRRVIDFAADELISLIRDALPQLFDGSIPASDVIVTYVPRRRESIGTYGYDHMKLCAMAVARRMRLRCLPLLKRRGGAHEQKQLGRRDRVKNAMTSIYCGERYKLCGKTIILLDDIVTTGASLNACEELLYDKGAKLIVAVALAATRRRL